MEKFLLLAIVSTVWLTSVQAVDVEAGLILNNDAAQKRCPEVCSAQNMAWSGHWTTGPGKMSVCGCIPNAEKAVEPTAQPAPVTPTEDSRPNGPMMEPSTWDKIREKRQW
jgi:hypothetical protein